MTQEEAFSRALIKVYSNPKYKKLRKEVESVTKKSEQKEIYKEKSKKTSKKKSKGAFSNKIFSGKKSRGPLVRKLSAVSAVKRLAQEQGPLVREVEERPEPIQDKRTLFFNQEFVNEEKKERGWLLR